MRYYLFLLTSLNLFLLLIIIYHEKLLNTLDLIKMPINEDLCKHIPFNLSILFQFFIIQIIIIISNLNFF